MSWSVRLTEENIRQVSDAYLKYQDKVAAQEFYDAEIRQHIERKTIVVQKKKNLSWQRKC